MWRRRPKRCPLLAPHCRRWGGGVGAKTETSPRGPPRTTPRVGSWQGRSWPRPRRGGAMRSALRLRRGARPRVGTPPHGKRARLLSRANRRCVGWRPRRWRAPSPTLAGQQFITAILPTTLPANVQGCVLNALCAAEAQDGVELRLLWSSPTQQVAHRAQRWCVVELEARTSSVEHSGYCELRALATVRAQEPPLVLATRLSTHQIDPEASLHRPRCSCPPTL